MSWRKTLRSARQGRRTRVAGNATIQVRGLRLALLFGAGLIGAPGLVAQKFLDDISDALAFSTPQGTARVDFSGTFDVEGYVFQDPAPGLIFGDAPFVNPRLTLFGEAQLGTQWYSYAQFQANRGFDPGAAVRNAQFYEYLLRWTPSPEGTVNLQVGEFATCFGNWVKRHLSWENPFVTAPTPYEQVLTISDVNAPPGPKAFLARRALPANKRAWVPLIWGPSYTTGASIFGSVEKLDYAVEFKNASISSRPAVWSGFDQGWSSPTVTTRVGWRPAPAWNIGISGSGGAYLLPSAVPTLPAGTSLNDFPQFTTGLDVSWSRQRWQIWSELFLSRFDVPNVGNADLLGWYAETKYKVTTHLWAAARMNVMVFGEVPDGLGGEAQWDNKAWRLDLALGWRFNQHWQMKVQYSYGREQSPGVQGNSLFAGQITLKF
ncbi:MAG TPA: hypothetical protein PLX89_25415 [Verrucomicrobiota bacterium]|nr:hypothetical protein [Verrucomicrobiota bacterium]